MVAPLLRRVSLAVSLLCLTWVQSVSAQPVRVGSKIDVEGALLGHMILLVLRANGIEAEDRIALGATRIVRGALLTGEIDIYPEYTGNGAFFFALEADPSWKNAAAGYEKVRALDAERNRLIWLKPAPADNAWAIALRADVAAANRVRTLEHFADWVNRGGAVKIAASSEFVHSPAALRAFQKAYGFELEPEQILILPGGDTTVTVRAASERREGANAAMAYGTDGALSANGLVILQDTKAAQVVYQPAPVVRAEVIRKHPRIRDLLEPLFARLDAPTLRALNARIAHEGVPARAAAETFLKAQGLLR